MTRARQTTKHLRAIEAAPAGAGMSARAELPRNTPPKSESRDAELRKRWVSGGWRPQAAQCASGEGARGGGEQEGRTKGERGSHSGSRCLDAQDGGRRPAATSVSPPAVSANMPLVVGVSTRALFDLEEEHAVFVREGEGAYSALQRQREAKTLRPGCAFELVRRLLALNPPGGPTLVEVVLISRNSPDFALRAFRSRERSGLAISEGSFTSGGPIAPFLAAWGVDLFLSNQQRRRPLRRRGGDGGGDPRVDSARTQTREFARGALRARRRRSHIRRRVRGDLS